MSSPLFLIISKSLDRLNNDLYALVSSHCALKHMELYAQDEGIQMLLQRLRCIVGVCQEGAKSKKVGTSRGSQANSSIFIVFNSLSML